MGKWGDRTRKPKFRAPRHARLASSQAIAAALAEGKSKEEADAAGAAALEHALEHGFPGGTDKSASGGDGKAEAAEPLDACPKSGKDDVAGGSSKSGKGGGTGGKGKQGKGKKEKAVGKGEFRTVEIPKSWNYVWSRRRPVRLAYLRKTDRWRVCTLTAVDCGAGVPVKGELHRTRFRDAVTESGFGPLPAFCGKRTQFLDSDDEDLGNSATSAPLALGSAKKPPDSELQEKADKEAEEIAIEQEMEERLKAHGEAFMAMFDD